MVIELLAEIKERMLSPGGHDTKKGDHPIYIVYGVITLVYEGIDCSLVAWCVLWTCKGIIDTFTTHLLFSCKNINIICFHNLFFAPFIKIVNEAWMKNLSESLEQFSLVGTAWANTQNTHREKLWSNGLSFKRVGRVNY